MKSVLISFILGVFSIPTFGQKLKCDLTGEGEVSIQDVSYLVNEILGKNPFVEPSFSGTINGHDWVDIGIRKSHLYSAIEPGSPQDKRIVFATCNIGASSISDQGFYFRWGELNGWKFTGTLNDGTALSSSNIVQQPKVGTVNKYASGKRETYSSDTFGKLTQTSENSYKETSSWLLYGKSGAKDFQLQIDYVLNNQIYGDAASYNWGGGWFMMNEPLVCLLASIKKSATHSFGTGSNIVTLKFTTFYTSENEYGAEGIKIENESLNTSVFFPYTCICSDETIKFRYNSKRNNQWTSIPDPQQNGWMAYCLNGFEGTSHCRPMYGLVIRPIAEIE